MAAAPAFLLSLTLAIWLAFTRTPWWDEGVFADVANNFCQSGHLGSSVLASHSFCNMPDVQSYTYWQFPFYLVSLGTWFHLVPTTVQWMRMFSVFWGAVFIMSWFLLVRAVSRNATLALCVAAVVSLDYSCLAAASDGRMDMMCAALGLAGLAAYVCLRESHLHWAALLTGLFGAASLFSHPMGIVTNAFIAVLLLSDFRRLRLSSWCLLISPYLFGGSLCLWYIEQAPQIFLAQSRAISSYRVGGAGFLLRNLVNDVWERYLQFYFAPHSGFHKLKIFSLLFGVVGWLALIINRRLRSSLLVKLLLGFACVGYLGVAAIDDMKFSYYLVYVTPVLAACGAVWVYDSFARRARSRVMAGALLAGFVMASLGLCGFYIHRDDFTHEYKPAIAAVRRLQSPGEVVMGPSEFGFIMGFKPPLVDDCFLGHKSGIRPGIYVMYGACRSLPDSLPEWQWAKKELAKNYREIYANGAYAVYARRYQTR